MSRYTMEPGKSFSLFYPIAFLLFAGILLVTKYTLRRSPAGGNSQTSNDIESLYNHERKIERPSSSMAIVNAGSTTGRPLGKPSREPSPLQLHLKSLYKKLPRLVYQSMTTSVTCLDVIVVICMCRQGPKSTANFASSTDLSMGYAHLFGYHFLGCLISEIQVPRLLLDYRSRWPTTYALFLFIIERY